MTVGFTPEPGICAWTLSPSTSAITSVKSPREPARQ